MFLTLREAHHVRLHVDPRHEVNPVCFTMQLLTNHNEVVHIVHSQQPFWITDTGVRVGELWCQFVKYVLLIVTVLSSEIQGIQPGYFIFTDRLDISVILGFYLILFLGRVSYKIIENTQPHADSVLRNIAETRTPSLQQNYHRIKSTV